jgi:hypothetical protein
MRRMATSVAASALFSEATCARTSSSMARRSDRRSASTGSAGDSGRTSCAMVSRAAAVPSGGRRPSRRQTESSRSRRVGALPGGAAPR